MKNFHRDNRDNKFDRERSRQMHKAICSECGKECAVPFRPTGDRPIFCSDCFGKQRGNMRFEKPQRNYREKPRFDDRRGYSAVCNKCGDKCEVPFKPSGEKPVYCKQCFGKSSNTAGQSIEQFKGQFEELNVKLDKILKLLTPVAAGAEVQIEKITKKTEEAKKDKSAFVKIKAISKKAKKK